jgi:hypothetical protein
MAYYWRLLYADGRVADEPDETTSIRVCPSGAMALAVCTGPEGRRVPVVMEYMDAPREPGHSPWQPVFYRRVGTSPGGETTIDGVVFGRACEGPNEIKTSLWAMRGGKPIDCPEWLIDQTACQSLVMESFSGVTR